MYKRIVSVVRLNHANLHFARLVHDFSSYVLTTSAWSTTEQS